VNNLDLVSDLVQKSDIVIHFAAETHVARSLYQNRVFFTTDVLGTQSVTNAVLKHADTLDRFIHVSTSEVYGTALYEPMDEDHPLNPKTPYAAAKAGADRLVYSYIQSYDIPGIILRPFNNYGTRQHLEKLIPRFITSALLREPLTVHGDGSAARDWIYVEDTVRAIDMAMHVPISKVRGEVFNLGTGVALSVLDIAETVLRLFELDRDCLTFMEERMGQVKKHISSTAKASEALGFKSQVSFDEGIRKTIEWFKGNKSYWERQLFMRKVPIKDKEGNIILF
jgi:dTDP-glucose 4,6-dehydratase